MSGTSITIFVGYLYRNQQRNLGLDTSNGADSGHKVYALRCKRPAAQGKPCGHFYGAFASDVLHRLCPKCQQAPPGLPLVRKYS